MERWRTSKIWMHFVYVDNMNAFCSSTQKNTENKSNLVKIFKLFFPTFTYKLLTTENSLWTMNGKSESPFSQYQKSFSNEQYFDKTLSKSIIWTFFFCFLKWFKERWPIRHYKSFSFSFKESPPRWPLSTPESRFFRWITLLLFIYRG